MDGFHLDNAVLEPRGLLPINGAPEKFDADGFVALVWSPVTDTPVDYPIFDRDLDRSIQGAGHLTPDIDTVVIEGNYLLLSRAPWSEHGTFWDYSAMLTAPLDVLRRRLLQRWLDQGFSLDMATQKTGRNDLLNAKTVIIESACDTIVKNVEA